MDAKSPAAREGAFLAFAGLADGAPRASEPFLVDLLENILEKCSDKVRTRHRAYGVDLPAARRFPRMSGLVARLSQRR